ncbi:hypothetical protein P3526_01285 [Vibrio parahaemolyticus]|uniref:hypothetical protein n=1 Tax=Vibrio parahaemolyticus TaxID=670 RepID=UPI002360698A|nr:hypothetical protein [Vibrio parahaemolyticus]MDF4662899.1 hypothetical protein [Vibrio parahaemolyticus]HCG5560047.1 hypothetical protein [Vibrio parahaemolyticus]
MYQEIFERMQAITQSGWLSVTEGLISENYYVTDSGKYVAVGHDGYLGLIKNNTLIYEYDDINLVKNIKLKVEETDSDVKLSVITGGGEPKVIHAKNREIVNNHVNYLFEIQDVPLLISFICPENKEYALLDMKISGDNVSELRDLIISIGDTFSNIKGSEEEITKELSKELVTLKNQKEELEEESKRLIETNQRLHDTKNVEENQLKQTKNYVESVKVELSDLNDELAKNLNEISKQSKEIRDNEKKINLFISEISDKEIIIQDLDDKIKKFKEEESMFSEDFSSYKAEVIKQNKTYTKLLLVFIALTTVISFVIYQSALSTVDNYQFNFDLWTHLVSRLPIIFINLFLLGALTSVIYFLINIITENSNNIAKTKQVSYLVKECVDAQKNGLDELDSDAVLKQRVESKMALIKSLITHNKDCVAQKIDKSGMQEIIVDLLKKESSTKNN